MKNNLERDIKSDPMLKRLKKHGNDGFAIGWEAAEEFERLLLCERRLAAMTVWLEQNQEDVFRRGLWDAINAA